MAVDSTVTNTNQNEGKESKRRSYIIVFGSLALVIALSAIALKTFVPEGGFFASSSACHVTHSGDDARVIFSGSGAKANCSDWTKTLSDEDSGWQHHSGDGKWGAPSKSTDVCQMTRDGGKVTVTDTGIGLVGTSACLLLSAEG